MAFRFSTSFCIIVISHLIFLNGCGTRHSSTKVIFDPRTDNYPFPSDIVHTSPSEETETGAILTPRLSRRELAKFSRIVTGFDFESPDIDGFSTTGPILITFTGWIDPDHLPPTPEASIQGGCPVMLINNDTDSPYSGESVPFTWNFDWGENALVLTPWIPLRPGNRYLLIISNTLIDENGEPVKPSSFFELMKANYRLVEELEPYREQYIGIFSHITAVTGLSKESIILALEFTAGSVGKRLGELIQDSITRPGPNVEVTGFPEDFHEHPAFQGEILLPDYLDWSGHLVPRDYHADTFPVLLPGYPLGFTLTFPEGTSTTLPDGTTAAVSSPFPLVIVQPDLFFPEPDITNLIKRLTMNGTATLLVENPARHHDSLSFPDSEPALIPGFDPDARQIDPIRLRDYFLQTAISLHVLAQTIQQISDLDIYPPGTTTPGDGSADIDLTRVGFLGRSSGAIAGILALSQQTNITSGVFQRIGGTLLEYITAHPYLSSTLDTLFASEGLSLKERSLLSHFISAMLDPIDPSNLLEFSEDSLNQPGLRNVLIQIAVPDFFVPNPTSFALSRATGLPLVAPEIVSGPGVEIISGPVSGNLPGAFTGGMSEFAVIGLKPGGLNDDRGSLQAARFFSTLFYSGEARILAPD